MQKILRRRVLRDLKANFFRYFALALLIVMGMYLIIGIVAAADTVVVGTHQKAAEDRVEDGQFSVFSPLTDSEQTRLEKAGVTLEDHSYLDFTAANGSVVRINGPREDIDLVALDCGAIPQNRDEIVLEKRYCDEHDLGIGDTVSLADRQFTVSGIGTTPDYESPCRNMSDSTINSALFGIGFVTQDSYDALVNTGKSLSAEEHVYAYRLGQDMTPRSLQKILDGFTISSDDIYDAFFQEYWEHTGGQVEEIREALKELSDGTQELADAMRGLSENSDKVKDGSQEIADAFLDSVNESLRPLGAEEMTWANYTDVLADLRESLSPIFGLRLLGIERQLNQLSAFNSGVTAYADSGAEAAKAAQELADGVHDLDREAQEFLDENLDVSLSKVTSVTPAFDNPRIGAGANDAKISQSVGLLAGVIVLILIAYVISVFTVRNIEEEASVIGTLYAQGVRKKELLRHYLMLPVILTLAAGMVGTALGYSHFGVGIMMQRSYSYYSMPALSPLFEPYLLVYGTGTPALAALLVNYLVIREKLGQPVLALIRGENRSARIAGIQLRGNFVRVFQTRQLLREGRSAVTMFFGMFISLLIVMIALNCMVLCGYIRDHTVQDTQFEYMYIYKYPEEEVPPGGEEACGVTMKKEVLGYQQDVMLLGLRDNSAYFTSTPMCATWIEAW